MHAREQYISVFDVGTVISKLSFLCIPVQCSCTVVRGGSLFAGRLQSWPKKFVLGCVTSPLLRQAESRNLGHTFLANSVGCSELAYLASMQQPLPTANIGIWQKIPHSGGTVTSIVPVRQNGISSFSLSSAPAPFFPRERANRPQRFPQSPSDVSSFNIPPPPPPS